MAKILQATLHSGIHTPKSGTLGNILNSEQTNDKQALKLTLEKVLGELVLIVEGTSKAAKTKGQTFRILVPMYNVVNLDLEPTTTETAKAV
jgi:hypothetical protein